ncbi:hypothetical protein PFX98_17855 [Paucibacter sediminis]|uniref:Uncharacterized protein n=1 Tax=Paucibacter sediminis TaxID=3019553 RepID=A0AA95NAZ3_9BURK|nr:hypothetical protein [Paucibacter sp. S2-9]WIT10765.1 hypothetical protein PFX98_17855 [Paucibacter sp. S2-9]
MVTAIGLMAGTSFMASAMGKAIQALYGVAGDANDFFNKHIAEMKTSSNPMIERTGRVLEAAKFGFGLGYMSSVVVIAVGQLILGNQLAATGAVATAAALSNPIAMSCAAFGAIYYGWNALTNSERDDILQKVCDGLQLGVELIKAVIGYVLQTAKDLLSSSVLKELATAVSSAAAQFGRTLAEIAHKTKARVTNGRDNGAAVAEGDTAELVDASPVELRQPADLLRQLVEADRSKGSHGELST